jgi:hypothetical protein
MLRLLIHPIPGDPHDFSSFLEAPPAVREDWEKGFELQLIHIILYLLINNTIPGFSPVPVFDPEHKDGFREFFRILSYIHVQR